MISAVKAACGLIVCGLLLAACAGANTNEKPLVISPVTNIWLQVHLRGGQGRSAFAVNEGGTHCFEAYCQSGACNGQYNIAQEAIKGCERFGHGRCLILAANGVLKRPYTVVGDLPALPSQGVTTDFVSGDRIRQELVGNSIVEANVEGKIWAEYFAPDGTLRGRTDDGRPFDGFWTIEGDTLCVDYNGTAPGWCGQFAERAGGSIDLYRNGKFRRTYPRSVLQKGNPQNL
jgi:hypothetical protein